MFGRREDFYERTNIGATTNKQVRKPLLQYSVAFIIGVVFVFVCVFAADKLNLYFTGPIQVAQLGKAPSNNNVSIIHATDRIVQPESIQDIVKEANPAVVLIKTYVSREKSNQSLFNDPFFRFFFDDPSQNKLDEKNNMVELGAGSGFFYKDSGYILTNQHVIEGADSVKVIVEGYPDPFEAKVAGQSYDYDLAVLKVENNKPFPTIPIGNSELENVGNWVIAIGNPMNFDHTVTVGVLSAKGRPLKIPDRNGERDYSNLLQTDASINPGNSGGPLLNLKGEVIGINTAVSVNAHGIGFAIPTATVAELIDRLENGIEIPRKPAPYIGIITQDVDQSWMNDLKLTKQEGVVVVEVQRNSPAFNGGIRPYDVIIEMNGSKISNAKELTEKIQNGQPGEQVKFSVIRNGSTIEIAVEIGDKNGN